MKFNLTNRKHKFAQLFCIEIPVFNAFLYRIRKRLLLVIHKIYCIRNIYIVHKVPNLIQFQNIIKSFSLYAWFSILKITKGVNIFRKT